MSVLDRMRRSVAPWLDADERVEVVFGAQDSARSGVLTMSYIVATTDRRILLLRTGLLRQAGDATYVDELPRDTDLGIPDGLSVWRLTAFRERLWVRRRFFGEVREADMWRPRNTS